MKCLKRTRTLTLPSPTTECGRGEYASLSHNLAEFSWPRGTGFPACPGRGGGGAAAPARCLLNPHAHRLGLGVVVEHLMPHLAAPARLLVAAKRQCRVEDVVAVDPYRTRAQLLSQGVRLADV